MFFGPSLCHGEWKMYLNAAHSVLSFTNHSYFIKSFPFTVPGYLSLYIKCRLNCAHIRSTSCFGLVFDFKHILPFHLNLRYQIRCQISTTQFTCALRDMQQSVSASPQRAAPCTEICCTAEAERPGYSPSCTCPMETR